MATIKSYTDISQSKKLAEILPIESADMYWEDITSAAFTGAPPEIAPTGNGFDWGFPSWSLAALLSVLPFPQLSKDKLGSGKVGWIISVYPNNCRYDSRWHDNPVDACYEMIIKLNELKIL